MWRAENNCWTGQSNGKNGKKLGKLTTSDELCTCTTPEDILNYTLTDQLRGTGKPDSNKMTDAIKQR